MRILLVTTWETACGIAEHSAYLKAAVEAADPKITILPEPVALNPYAVDIHNGEYDILHLNYHAALHSRWTPELIQSVKGPQKVVVTYHDTGVPNSDQCLSILRVADAGVVHEPCDDIIGDAALGPKIRYWRQGVPEARGSYDFGLKVNGKADGYLFKDFLHQPVLGTVGFPFPWKHYAHLASVTARAGWALVLIAPQATEEQETQWRTINPSILVLRNFVDRTRVVSLLSGCDATAFCYVTHNTGTSGAIRQGIAARKPVIAFYTCRQFRDLFNDDLGHRAIRWCETFDDVYEQLTFRIALGKADPPTIALAQQDSWAQLGQRYAQLYRGLVA